MNVKTAIEESVDEALCAIESLKRPESLSFIESVSSCLAECFQRGNKLLIAGNGGSMCDAMHCAEEFTGVFREKRRALPAIALSDVGHLTCVGNDLGYEQVFARSIEAWGRPGDVFIGLTTSGNSPNIIHAIQRAKELGLSTVAFLGKSGGKLKGIGDLEWIVSGFRYSDRVQEAHMAALHIIIEQVERILFYPHGGLITENESIKASQ